MNAYRHIRNEPTTVLIVIVTCALSLMFCGCAQPATAAAPQLSQGQKTILVQQLSAARKADWNNALDPSVNPVTEDDFLSQMNKADKAIKELTHGFDVSPSELDDALWVPPKSLSAGRCDALIQRLEAARRQDDRNEQAMLNGEAWVDSIAPAQTSQFDDQKALVDDVIKDLEIGEAVRWSKIREALIVPPDPY